jgi:rubrerythrin
MASEPHFTSVDDIISFAIRREEEAARGYAELAEAAQTPGIRELLLELKGEEENHKKILENVSAEDIGRMAPAFVPDLKISDYLVEETLSSDMTFQELLIFAARKEKKAAELYERLAGMAPGAEGRKVFEFLAGQEKSHKLKLETEYEKQVMWEN